MDIDDALASLDDMEDTPVDGFDALDLDMDLDSEGGETFDELPDEGEEGAGEFILAVSEDDIAEFASDELGKELTDEQIDEIRTKIEELDWQQCVKDVVGDEEKLDKEDEESEEETDEEETEEE